MGNTAIQWTEKTWNPVVGCTKVSEGSRFDWPIVLTARTNLGTSGLDEVGFKSHLRASPSRAGLGSQRVSLRGSKHAGEPLARLRPV